MNTIKKHIILIILILGILIIGAVYLIPKGEEEIISIESSAKKVEEDIESVKNQEQVYTWLGNKELEVGYLEGKDEDVFNKYRVKKGVVEYLFATILLKDPNHFVQSFQPTNISEDLFSVENPDKIEVATNMINRISRNGKLSKISYTDNKVSFKDGETAKVKVYYTDDKIVTLNLSFSRTPTHHDEEDGIYSIETSVWDIIKEIEKGTK